MNRKDYLAIANALLNTKANRETCVAITEVYQRDNPNFDQQRFLQACGF